MCSFAYIIDRGQCVAVLVATFLCDHCTLLSPLIEAGVMECSPGDEVLL